MRIAGGVAVAALGGLALAAPTGPEGRPAYAPYLGAASCGSCHEAMHAKWQGGRHSRMLQPATTASVKGDFTRPSVRLRGLRYGLRGADGAFFITESYLTGAPRERRVDYTLGSRRIQHYLTTLE